MSLHDRYGLTRVINARGTFTPLGVSRSSPHVAASVGQALGEFFVIDELQSVFSRAIAQSTGAQAGAVVHCVAAGITLSVAAAIIGCDRDRIAALPRTTGMPFSRVCLTVEAAGNGWNASTLAARLQAGDPPIWLMDQAAPDGRLYLELVPLQEHEIRLIVDRIAALVQAQPGSPPHKRGVAGSMSKHDQASS